MTKKGLILCLVLILSIFSAMALKVISPYPIGEKVNYSAVNVNNSLYWDGHAYSNLISQWTNDAGYLIYESNYSSNPLGYYNVSTIPAELDPFSLHLDQSTPQTITGGTPLTQTGLGFQDIYANYVNTIFTNDYGYLTFDTLTSGSGYIYLDPYGYYYIDPSYGYTNLMVDYAYYSDTTNYAYTADYANTAGSVTNSDTVDSIHASSTATANYLYPLDSSANNGLTKTYPKSYLKDNTTNRRTELIKNSTNDMAERINEVISYDVIPYSLDVNASVNGTMSATDYGDVYSIFFWIKDLETQIKVLLSDGTGTAIYFDARYLRHITGGSPQGGSTNYVPGSGWARFAIVRNGTSLKFYRNGIATYFISTGAVGNFNGIDEFGKLGTTYRFDAQVDELVIYSDAKDQAFVTADYNSGMGRYAETTDANIVNIWHMDDKTGTTLVDSKSGNNITLSSTPEWMPGEKSIDGGAVNVTIWKHTGDNSTTGSRGILQIGDNGLDYYSMEYAEIKPKIYNLSTEPDITNNSFSFWINNSDNKYYLVLDIEGTQKKVELT